MKQSKLNRDGRAAGLAEVISCAGGDAATEKGLVGGVEACFWSEFIDATNFISRTF